MFDYRLFRLSSFAFFGLYLLAIFAILPAPWQLCQCLSVLLMIICCLLLIYFFGYSAGAVTLLGLFSLVP